MLSVLLGVLLALPQSSKDLIEALGALDPGTRDGASKALVEQGTDAVPELLGALDHPDREVASRVRDLLKKIGPARWLPKVLRHPRALDFFHDAHPVLLKRDGVDRVSGFLEHDQGFAISLDSRRDRAASVGFVVFRAGALGAGDPENLVYTGNKIHGVPDKRPVEVTMNEGAVVAAFKGEMPARPFCALLWERILKDPHDPQAGCLLADVLDPSLVPVLQSFLKAEDAWSGAALSILSNYWAKTGTFDPSPEYFARLEAAVDTMRWGLAAPVAILATRHPDRFAALMKRGFASRNKWYQYLALGSTRVLARSDLYDPSIVGFLKSPLFDLHREAVCAILAAAPKEALPVREVVESVLAQKHPEEFVYAFRARLDPRLGLELAKNLDRSLRLSLYVMDVYRSDDAVVAAFCEGLPASLRRYEAEQVLDLLKRFADGTDRLPPRKALARFLRDPDAETADIALRNLALVAAQHALPDFRALLQTEDRELRRRGVEGVYAVWLTAPARSESRPAAIAAIEAFLAGAEKDAGLKNLARTYARAMKGETGFVRPDDRRVPIPPVTGCPGPVYDTGWKPLLKTPFERPFWKD